MGESILSAGPASTKADYVQETETAAALVVDGDELKIWIGSSLTNQTEIVNGLRACAKALRDQGYPSAVLGSDLAVNGAFAADTDWTKGTGWTIAAGVASSDGSQAGDADLTQDLSLVQGETYRVTFTVSNYSAGNVTPVVGDTEGTDRGEDGTFTEDIVCGAGTDLDIRADLDFVGDIDDVSIVQIGGFEIIATLEQGGSALDAVITNQAALPTFTETQVAILVGSAWGTAGSSVFFDTQIKRLIEFYQEAVLKAA